MGFLAVDIMTNGEWLRDLDNERLAEVIADGICGICFYNRHGLKCSGYECSCQECERGIAKWLSEGNSMPEIKVGDIVDADGLHYVAINPTTFVSGGMQFCFEDIKSKIKNIQRYDENVYQTIWKADDND